MVRLTELNLETRLEIEAVACLLITQIIHLIREISDKIDELNSIIG
jgi:hypothetical protein